MIAKAKSISVKLDDLVLDVNNPRFAELYSGSHKEEDLIEYLLYTEAAEEVAKAIVKAEEFYPDRPLWVLEDSGKYIVKDGNRRCSAVKALQMPGKYKLDLPKTTIEELPVLLYTNQNDIDARIVEEHAGNLFRRWERIAKALEVLKLYDAGRFDEVKDLDSKPGDLIKLASFYKEAVVIGGDDLRQLLRRGRGKSGGKTIIFERLFRNSRECGYYFKNSPSYKVEIVDNHKFSSYIKAMVDYLKDHPDTTTETIDRDQHFLKRLKDYGFDINPKTTNTSTDTGATNPTGTSSSATGSATPNNSSGSSQNGDSGKTNPDGATNPAQGNTGTNSTSSGSSSTTKSNGGRGSVKKHPILKRKSLSPVIKDLIKEYFDLDPNIYTNSKIAMARVTFECVLKYVIEDTKFNGRTLMKKSGHFGPVYNGKKYTDFTLMKTKFTELITIAVDRNAFNSFDLEHLHQIIHNYKVGAVCTSAIQISNNLMQLIEFLLQDEAELLSSLDTTKL